MSGGFFCTFVMEEFVLEDQNGDHTNRNSSYSKTASVIEQGQLSLANQYPNKVKNNDA